jgi:hypothetical protein
VAGDDGEYEPLLRTLPGRAVAAASSARMPGGGEAFLPVDSFVRCGQGEYRRLGERVLTGSVLVLREGGH